MSIKVSVVICSHNPREDYLARVLAALKAQTLPLSEWELLLIDNASANRLAAAWDISWHPNGRHVREENLGLTPARLRGIAESNSDLLVFVDDDNELAEDYLAKTALIAVEWPTLGVWGGSIDGEYEVQPASWAVPYLSRLAIRTIDAPRWSNIISDEAALPFGAGMCIRRSIGEEYARYAKNDEISQSLDRKGGDLTSGGDDDLCLVARRHRFGTGVFPQLRLKHLIPASRLEEQYMARLIEGLHFSGAILRFKTRGTIHRPSMTDAVKFCYHYLRRTARDRRFYVASQRGEYRAWKFLKLYFAR